MNKEQNAEKKEYTAFGVTGGIGTMFILFIMLLLTKYAYVIWTFFPEFIKNIKSLFGG